MGSMFYCWLCVEIQSLKLAHYSSRSSNHGENFVNMRYLAQQLISHERVACLSSLCPIGTLFFWLKFSITGDSQVTKILSAVLLAQLL